MTAQALSACMPRVGRRMLVIALFALSACGYGAGNSPTKNTDVRISISGNLTLKGAQPGAWWAVTDDQGRVWKITAPTPDQTAIFQQAQNHRVSIEGRQQEKYLNFEQIQPSRVTVAP